MKKLLSLIVLLAAGWAFAGGTGSIVGTITDAASGNPVPNALVTAQGRNNSGGQAYTDERGHYLIENLEPGQYRVRAEHRHYEPGAYGSPVRVMANQPTTGVHIRLRPKQQEPGVITGRVTDRATGEPISGAAVVARGPSGGGRATTNRNGEYAIQGLQPGRYQVAAAAKRYLREQYPEPVTVQAGQVTPDIDFQLSH
ncbi:MAG: carboxypeptidase-like regulatory domain-containing protein, partial [candidate division WOR-3 bacterium]